MFKTAGSERELLGTASALRTCYTTTTTTTILATATAKPTVSIPALTAANAVLLLQFNSERFPAN
jgi:hypothetical protein